ncbi:sarcoplasmic calcium-binding protein 1-like [Limulus polyphemus]|uniref:Sarcoplasmic calcium-binding protein 1-like n=1 Tax=Limulus polyphemus TaxID=6850 RepID=A0ABM1BD19_LIMPO|nr:sarcoplasmic calcium-binding protein 1-like [Limulus polyphemus]XP_013779541.1 sarcoplasmic calcium-binding protein 1-like [Limulus polyphemus]XP_022247579.1 sarcoplasmic calcium-binding protein 1-like [Limulus polyphemus]
MGREDYERRLTIFFSEKLDADKNGYISWADYELLALRTTFQQNSGKYDEGIHEKYLTHSRKMWESLCSDIGGDTEGQVQFTDLVNFMFVLTSKTQKFEELPDFLQNLATEVFYMVDKNGDNMWDKEEYRFGSVLWCYVTSLKGIDDAFNSMLNEEDKQRGGLSIDRFKKLVTEFFTSLEADTPCRNIFGPLDPSRADKMLTRDVSK